MPRTRTLVVAGLALALLLAGLLSAFASESPDGLERVTADHGLDARTREHPLADSPLAGYATRDLEGDLSGGVAGVAGVTVTLALSGALFLVLRRRPAPQPPRHAPRTPRDHTPDEA